MFKLNLLLGLLGLVLLVDIIVFGVVVFYDSGHGPAAELDIVRVGVVADPDRLENAKVLADFFQETGDHVGFKLVPCFSPSEEEAVTGFIHGSVDLLLINPACFLMLRDKFKAKPVVRQRISRSESDYNHAVLMTTKKIDDLLDTRGFRLTYKDPYAMGGYLVPSRYIAGSLRNPPPNQWFKSISFSSSDLLSLQDLVDGRTDLIAVDLLSLAGSDLYRKNIRKINMFWISPGLPETLICVSFQSEYYARNDLLQRIASSLWLNSRRDPIFNRSSMFFEPIDFLYETELKKLDDYLKSFKLEPKVL